MKRVLKRKNSLAACVSILVVISLGIAIAEDVIVEEGDLSATTGTFDTGYVDGKLHVNYGLNDLDNFLMLCGGTGSDEDSTGGTILWCYRRDNYIAGYTFANCDKKFVWQKNLDSIIYCIYSDLVNHNILK